MCESAFFDIKIIRIFLKSLNEIKYLCKVATAGSKEARELEKVKSAFDKAYKESGTEKFNTKGEIKYSISEIVDQNNKSYGIGVKLDSTLLENLSPKERVKMVKEYVKKLGGKVFVAYDNDGNAINITIADKSSRFKTHKGKIKPVNKDLYSKYIKNEVKQEGIVLVNELITTSKYENSNNSLYTHDWLDDNGNNDWEYWTTYIQDKNNTIWEATLNIANTSNDEKILYDIYPIKKAGQSVKSDTSSANIILPQNSEKSSGNAKYSLSNDVDIEHLLFDNEFYSIYESEDKSIINQSEAELQAELKAIDDNYTDEDFYKRYSVLTKLRAIRKGYKSEYEYFVSEAKKRKLEEYKSNPQKFERLYAEKIRKAEEQKQLAKEIEDAIPLKREQYYIIQEYNPAPNSNYVWVRSPKDIKTFDEVINDEDSFNWGDYSKEDAIRDLKRNKITIYSSYPIRQGVFVSTSFVQAQDYAGGDGSKVYSKEVPLDAVAWINGDEGQYAKVSKSKYSIYKESKTPNEYGNFNIYGKDIKYQNTEGVAPIQDNVSEQETVAPVQTVNNAPTEDLLPEDYAPLTEKQAIEMFKNDKERFYALDDADAPPETSTEPYYSADTTRLDQKTLNNISAILKEQLTLNKAETKAIQDIVQNYSTSEFPSKIDLFNEIKERFGEKAWAERNEEIAEVKRLLRNYKLLVSPTIKTDITDYSDFMRRNFGKIRFSKEGTPVDIAYMELSAEYPEYFPADVTNATDQLLRMSEVANMDIKEYITEALDDETIQEATDIIADIVSTTKEAEIRKSFQAENEEFFKLLARENNEIAPTKEIAKQTETKNANKGTEEKVAEILTEEPKVEKKKSRAWSKFVSNFVDKASPFETLSLKTGNRDVDAKYNSIRYAEGKAQNLIGKGAKGVKALKDIQAEVEGEGLTSELYEYLYHKHNIDRMSLESRDAFNQAKLHELKFDALEEKQLYAIAKESITEKTSEKRANIINAVRDYFAFKGAKNKAVFGDSVTAEMSQEIVDKYERENPKLIEHAQDVYIYNTYLRNLLVENGVISQETADLWEKMYPHYVPISRIGVEGLNINVPLDTGRTGINAPVKRATGGNSDIRPLFDIMAERTLQTYKAIAKNRFGVELKNTLGTTIENENASLDDIIDSIDTQESLLQEGKNGKNPTFTVFENGEKVTFEITEEMYDALKPTSEGLAYTNKVANKITNAMRGVLTEYNPTFMFTNAIKDAQDVLINSQHPASTYKNFPEAILELTRKSGKWYTEYMENGGEDNTYFEKQTKTFATEKSGLSKVVGFPLEKISEANNFIEKIPRLAEYIASREAGRSIDVAMLDSARVTTNFGAGGDVTKFLNRNGATFLNASVQGAVQQVRNVREAKYNGLKGWVQLASKIALAGLPAMLLNGLLWDDDEDYQELSEYIKDNYYIVGKMQDGTFVRIPKGRATAVIQNAFEQVKNALTGDDEVNLGRFLDLAITNLAPNNPLDNNIIAPIIQVAKNKTWYGEDLIPARLQDVPKGEQYDETTDVISKWLGEKIGISPYKFNYLLNQYSGGIGDVVLPMLTPKAESGDNSIGGNLLAPLKDKFTTDGVLKNQNVSDFYDTIEKLKVNANSSKATDEDVLKNKYFNAIQSELGELYAEKRELQNSNLTDEIKYKKVRDIQEEINALAREALNTYENVNIDGNYAYIGDKHYHLTDENEWKKITDEQLEKQKDVTSGLGITPTEYWSNKAEYDLAYKSPEKYALAKAVGGYNAYTTYSSELYDIKADKDENGKSISGSRKEKVIEYINNLDADYYEKIILFKNEYNADDTYNNEIIDYLNKREDISYQEMVTILKELGFNVDSKGNISW